MPGRALRLRSDYLRYRNYLGVGNPSMPGGALTQKARSIWSGLFAANKYRCRQEDVSGDKPQGRPRDRCLYLEKLKVFRLSRIARWQNSMCRVQYGHSTTKEPQAIYPSRPAVTRKDAYSHPTNTCGAEKPIFPMHNLHRARRPDE
jgi:hypothetical protein